MGVVGYSGKSLRAKLGIKPGDAVLAIGAPEQYADLLAPLPESARIVESEEAPAIVHAFFTDRAALAASAESIVRLPCEGGMLWISWPKKASAMFRDLTEDGVRELVLPTGWVDVKVCAVDADWSGLMFRRRRA